MTTPQKVHHSFFPASADLALTHSDKSRVREMDYQQQGIGTEEDEVTLKVDGSVLRDRSSGCGGYLQSHDGHWLGGFNCKLIMVPSTIAELLGIYYGLTWC